MLAPAFTAKIMRLVVKDLVLGFLIIVKILQPLLQNVPYTTPIFFLIF